MGKKFVSILVCFIAGLSVVASVNIFAGDSYLSPSAITVDATASKLYIAETTARQVSVLDLQTNQVLSRISLAAEPTGLVLSADGSQLYVTAGLSVGSIVVIDVKTQKITGELPAGFGPISPVLSHEGSKLYVCNQFNDSVSVIDLVLKKEIAAIPVARQPVAAAITPDGTTLFVANLLPSGRANGDYNAAVISVIDTTGDKLSKNIQLPNGTIDIKGICVSPDGQYAYAAHIIARYHLPTTQLDRGWMNTNALSIIDARSDKYINTVLLDEPDLGAANPWAVACTSKTLLVTHAGTHEVSLIDRVAFHKKLNERKIPEGSDQPESVNSDLSFLIGLRKRIFLKGIGPRAIAVADSKAYMTEYFSGSIGIVELESKDNGSAVRSVKLGEEPTMTMARRGEMLFHDGGFCFQKWQSCASCHPGNGRVDGINWDLLNDGVGNPKQTKSLLLSHQTPPAMISGVRPDAETAVRAGMRHIQFVVRPEEDTAAIDEYLKSLKPITSPRLVRGLSGKFELSDAAKRGKQLFEQAKCGMCHSGQFYTNMRKYDVGTGIGREQGVAFDTPILNEVWRTAPYLYDGRAATMKDVLTLYNQNDKHGVTSSLTEEEIDDLVEYIMSL